MCALWCTSNVLGIQYSTSTWIIVCLSVTIIYQLNRVSDFTEDCYNAPREYAFNSKYSREIVSVAVIAGAILCVYLIKNLILIVYVFPLLGLGLFYNFKILNSTRLKDIPVVKNIASAFGWSFATVIFQAWLIIRRYNRPL